MQHLSDRQAAVLALVTSHYLRYGYGPPVRKLALDLGLASPATVHEHLRRLHRQGYVRFAGRAGYVPAHRL